ncbi:MAG TPA: galactokinase [Bryobacteraceae bacterium]|nr:galactokinase [Bryobacteraceae bacterium]
MAGAAAILNKFHARYPASIAPRVWRAPGRVNLIGEHTDYNLGLVLPMAIDLACHVVIAASGSASEKDQWLRVYSEQLGAGSQWRIEDIPNASPVGDWTDRVAGIAWELSRRGVELRGANLLIDSDVPVGGGLSSSAALGVALALALGGPREPLELAKLARTAEMDFVGVPCGIMDQFISAAGQAGSAMFLDCRSLKSRSVKLPADVAILSANTMVRHQLGDSAYRIRVEECAEASRRLGVSSLRDAKLDGLSKLKGALLKRARHIITENARVERFVEAAERDDPAAMGRIVTESHASLRDDYEVSSVELDFMVEAALEVEGVYGARMIGGGFGGSTVNLVRPEAVGALKATLEAKYRNYYGLAPEIHVCIASAGASEVIY